MASGRFIIETVESSCLVGNPLNDPHLREVPVFLPPNYESDSEEYPVIYLLTGFSGRGINLLNREPFNETLEDRLNRLIAKNMMVPAIVVAPDCFTYYGGSQYIDSEATGQYETHIVEELIPFIDNKYRTISEPSRRAVMGKSSGGYGALVLALRHPDLFGIAASHSGDAAFEYCYLPDFPAAMIELERFPSILDYMRDFYAQPKKKPSSFLTINVLAMAACYSPNVDAKPHLFDLPFDARTGELRDDVWQRWLKWDPVRMVDELSENARSIEFFIDCGIHDEHRLYAGARILSEKLNRQGIKHTHEEFEANHRGLNYRYDRSLEFISKAFD